jgi:antitoxin component of MazEF toxin-antitoxin module
MRMNSRLVQIGNSKGIRLNRAVLEHAALGNELEITAEPGLISIRAARPARAGWEAAAAALGGAQGEGREPVVEYTPTAFEDEWEW